MASVPLKCLIFVQYRRAMKGYWSTISNNICNLLATDDRREEGASPRTQISIYNTQSLTQSLRSFVRSFVFTSNT